MLVVIKVSGEWNNKLDITFSQLQQVAVVGDSPENRVGLGSLSGKLTIGKLIVH